MKRCAVTLFSLFLLVAALAGRARADDRAEIDALYAKLQQALKNQTPETTLALETPDFKATGADGKAISGKELVQQMKQENAGVKSVKEVNISIKKTRIAGKKASVTTNFGYTVVVADPEGHMGPKGATHEMSMNGEVQNDLVKTGAGWKFKTMRQGAGKMLVDGKPVPQAPPSGGQRKGPKRG